MTEANVISLSGGKDSTATLLTAIEREVDNLTAVFADTGNEHPETYDYVHYLERATGVKIKWVRADFSTDIERKRRFIEEKWFDDLVAGAPGKWRAANDNKNPGEPPPAPADPYRKLQVDAWKWQPAVPPMAEQQARQVVETALSVLQPTGNPYLDLCLWKGRFPSRMAQFCTQQLKVYPIHEQVLLPMIDNREFSRIVCWQGVRAEESPSRAQLPEWEAEMDTGNGGGLWNYRPILQWSVEQVFAAHRRHGIKPNPLYRQGMTRVGCMPCINCQKSELRQIAMRFPEELERIRKWEQLVSMAAKRGMATFFAVKGVANDNVSLEQHGIMAKADWSKTTRGGNTYDLIALTEEPQACQSAYGLCE